MCTGRETTWQQAWLRELVQELVDGPVDTTGEPDNWAGFKWNPFQYNQALAMLLDEDRLRDALIQHLGQSDSDEIGLFPSASTPDDNERSRPYSKAAPSRHIGAFMVTRLDDIVSILRDTNRFSNVPYAEIGDRSFALAMDPAGNSGFDAHGRQHQYIARLLSTLSGEPLSKLAVESVRHATVTELTRDQFDMCALAEQAAVRFCGLWFGFGINDHHLIQVAARAGYGALRYQILGRHFYTDPTLLPAARAAMAKLSARIADLLAEYQRCAVLPRDIPGNLHHREQRARWPEGITPLSEWNLGLVGPPLLKRMAHDADDFTIAELASMATGLIVGTVGNITAGASLVMQALMADGSAPGNPGSGALVQARRAAYENGHHVHQGELHNMVQQRLLADPPVAFLPRRVVAEGVCIGGQQIDPGQDVILWLSAASKRKLASRGYDDLSLPFGGTTNAHYCLGQPHSVALVTAIVSRVLQLDSLGELIDPVTGKPEGLTRHYGFGCERYPLTHKREVRLVQQPLNVVMRVKSPVDQHSEALRRIIYVGAPRIQQALDASAHVHVAWFQLLDNGRYLALHTVYDGNFDAYILDFAHKVDDMFDRLFEHIEGAPPLPVAENPGPFVDTIRAHNLPALNNFFYSAYPTREVPSLTRPGAL